MVDLSTVYRQEGNFFVNCEIMERVFDYENNKFVSAQIQSGARDMWREIERDFRRDFPQIMCPTTWCKQGSRGGIRNVSIDLETEQA